MTSCSTLKSACRHAAVFACGVWLCSPGMGICSVVKLTGSEGNDDPSVASPRDRQSRPETIASIPAARVQRVASTNCTVLLTGETGVGKGYLAERIHKFSARASKPFLPVNCGAIPESLVDSQLFGHVRGAFSDAHRDHPGFVRAARGGTLFLDEVGELPPLTQTRLLRLLEEREVQPVGAPGPVPVDVRIIAATNRDLLDAVRRGEFRSDLFYRLDVIHFAMTPMRDRIDEVSEFFDERNRRQAVDMEREPLQLTAAAREMLRRHTWPGNVREIFTVVERMLILHGTDPVTPEDLVAIGKLPVDLLRSKTRTTPAKDWRTDGVRAARLEVAHATLQKCAGSVSAAAASLGVHRSTLHRWLAAGMQSS